MILVPEISKQLLSAHSVSGAVAEIQWPTRGQTLCPIDLTFWCRGGIQGRRQAVNKWYELEICATEGNGAEKDVQGATCEEGIII